MNLNINRVKIIVTDSKNKMEDIREVLNNYIEIRLSKWRTIAIFWYFQQVPNQ